jgi:hypothetical protein
VRQVADSVAGTAVRYFIAKPSELFMASVKMGPSHDGATGWPSRGPKPDSASPQLPDQFRVPPNLQWPGLFSWVRCPGRELDHTLPSSAKVKNEWSYGSTPSPRLHDMERDNLYLLFYNTRLAARDMKSARKATMPDWGQHVHNTCKLASIIGIRSAWLRVTSDSCDSGKSCSFPRVWCIDTTGFCSGEGLTNICS